MPRYTVDARWDGDAHAWVATSDDVPGIAVEASTHEEVVEVVADALPDILRANSVEGAATRVSVVFGTRVETIEVATA